MERLDHIYVKIFVLVVFLLALIYTLVSQSTHYGLHERLSTFYRTFNSSSIAEILKKIAATVAVNATIIVSNQTTMTTSSTTSLTSTKITTTTASVTTTLLTTTSTTGRPTTLDPAELLVERAPSTERRRISNSLVAFIFQTQHHVLADLQMYLLRKLGTDLVAIELFLDGRETTEMKAAAQRHGAILHPSPPNIHPANAGPSDRNTDVVNWAISTYAKRYLGNGTAILLLDGDVFPLSPFDSVTLLNSRDLLCRKHPAIFARFCWIGFICLSPELYNTIDNFDVSQTSRGGKSYDAGGKTADFLLKYENTSFSYMRETILLETDKNLFWGAMDEDIQWIRSNFGRCDKCGPEIFFSPFGNSNAVFYHMISATSEWRFGHQAPRRQSVHNAVMRSPYGPNQTMSRSDVFASVQKVQKMQMIPMFGNLTCERICGGWFVLLLVKLLSFLFDIRE